MAIARFSDRTWLSAGSRGTSARAKASQLAFPRLHDRKAHRLRPQDRRLRQRCQQPRPRHRRFPRTRRPHDCQQARRIQLRMHRLEPLPQRSRQRLATEEQMRFIGLKRRQARDRIAPRRVRRRPTALVLCKSFRRVLLQRRDQLDWRDEREEKRGLFLPIDMSANPLCRGREEIQAERIESASIGRTARSSCRSSCLLRGQGLIRRAPQGE